MKENEINRIKADLTNYVLDELEYARNSNCDMSSMINARNRAYSVLQFVNNKVIPFDQKLSDWWNNTIRDDFLKKNF